MESEHGVRAWRQHTGRFDLQGHSSSILWSRLSQPHTREELRTRGATSWQFSTYWQTCSCMLANHSDQGSEADMSIGSEHGTRADSAFPFFACDPHRYPLKPPASETLMTMGFKPYGAPCTLYKSFPPILVPPTQSVSFHHQVSGTSCAYSRQLFSTCGSCSPSKRWGLIYPLNFRGPSRCPSAAAVADPAEEEMANKINAYSQLSPLLYPKGETGLAPE
ncbi:hypothetical protein BGZ63DRAFT_33752 [Mariannaea sp. PMI_226]|nr:hypothetical protein BGZ63DRAFT_33752 [Mariannaea sp. PMI_226]